MLNWNNHTPDERFDFMPDSLEKRSRLVAGSVVAHALVIEGLTIDPFAGLLVSVLAAASPGQRWFGDRFKTVDDRIAETVNDWRESLGDQEYTFRDLYDSIYVWAMERDDHAELVTVCLLGMNCERYVLEEWAGKNAVRNYLNHSNRLLRTLDNAVQEDVRATDYFKDKLIRCMTERN